MKAKILIAALTAALASATATARTEQSAAQADSLSRELQEVVVTAKQPATKLDRKSVV